MTMTPFYWIAATSSHGLCWGDVKMPLNHEFGNSLVIRRHRRENVDGLKEIVPVVRR